MMLRSSWRDLRWSGKHYYLTSTGPPELASVRALVEWLDRVVDVAAFHQPLAGGEPPVERDRR
jgi:hypothetical protein